MSLDLDSDITAPSLIPNAPPPLQDDGFAGTDVRREVPKGLTNVFHLCELKQLTLRCFTCSEDYIVPAFKHALLKAGLAACWRARPEKESSRFDGPGSKVSAQNQNQEGSGVPTVYELWTFGTSQLNKKVKENSNGAFDHLTEVPQTKSQQEPRVVGEKECMVSVPDFLILLQDAFSNRFERILASKGYIRMGDAFVPVCVDDLVASGGPIHSVHLQCFTRNQSLMGALNVKMKRLTQLTEPDMDRRQGSVDVLLSPAGLPAVLKPQRPGQTKPGQAERVIAEWVELGEVGGLPSTAPNAETERTKLSQVVTVEVDGDCVVYPRSRVMRVLPNAIPDAAHLDHIWLGTGARPWAGHSGGRPPNTMSANSVKSLRCFLTSPKGGLLEFGNQMKFSQVPFSGYWVFAGIPQHCIKPLTKAKKLVDAPVSSSGADSHGDKTTTSGLPGAGDGDAIKMGVENKRKNPPSPVAVPPVGSTPGPSASKRKKGNTPMSKDVKTIDLEKLTAPGGSTTSGQGGVALDESGRGESEVLAAGGGTPSGVDAGKKGGKKPPARGKGKKEEDGKGDETPSIEQLSSLTSPRKKDGGTDFFATEPCQRVETTTAEMLDIGDLANDLITEGEFEAFDEIVWDFASSDIAHSDFGVDSELRDEDGTSSLQAKQGGGEMDLEEDERGMFDNPTTPAPQTVGLEDTTKPGETGGEASKSDEKHSDDVVEIIGDTAGSVLKALPQRQQQMKCIGTQEEGAKDEEMIGKKLKQLPPVVRRPYLLTGKKDCFIGAGMPRGVPWLNQISYAPCTELPVVIGDVDKPPPAEKEKSKAEAVKNDSQDSTEHDVIEIPAPQEKEVQHSSLGKKPPGALFKGGPAGATPRTQSAAAKLSPESFQRGWWQTRSVQAFHKSWRDRAIRDRAMRMFGQQSNWPQSREKLMEGGVGKMTALEHRLIQQLAETSFDMPVKFSILTPNSPMAHTSSYTVNSAMLCRHSLTKEGSGPHNSLDYLLRSECGGDPRVLMALDPLSLPTHPARVAAALSHLHSCLDELVPGVPHRRSLLDIPGLFGSDDKATQDDIVEELPVPNLMVGGADGHWVETPPAAIRWWDKIPLEPYAKKKDILYVVLCPSASADQQGAGSHEAVAAQMFFKELSCAFESAHLGTHRYLDSKYLGGAGHNAASKEGIVLVNTNIQITPAGVAMGPTGFDVACAQAFKGFTQYQSEKPTSTQAMNAQKAIPVVYILEPDFAMGSTWGEPRTEQVSSPAKMRQQWQKALAKSLSLAAQKNARLLDLVVQIVPSQRVNCGRKMRLFLRDLAMSVYSKGRNRIRTKKERDSGPFVDVDDDLSYFFSGSLLTIKKQRVDPKLYEPLLVLADKRHEDEPKPDLTKELLVAPPPETPTAGKRPEDEMFKIPTVHLAYSWSDDGLCLGGCISDEIGEMLETFTAFFGGVGKPKSEDSARDLALRSMVSKLWASCEEWIKRSYTEKVRVVIGSLGIPGPRDLEDWKLVLNPSLVPSSCVAEVMIVQVGICRALQILSTPDIAASKKQPDTTVEGWPFSFEKVTSMEYAASSQLEPRPSYLIKTKHEFVFPPALPMNTSPLASTVLVSPSPRLQEENLRRDADCRSSWPIYMDLSLLFFKSDIKDTRALADRHQEAVVAIARSYHNMSWCTVHPCHPLRQSVLPGHFLVAKRLSVAASTSV